MQLWFMCALGRWTSKFSWLPRLALPADVLRDFNVQDGRLSMFVIGEEATAERIAVAMAANRQRADKVDFVVCDQDELSAAGYVMERTAGDTPDLVVNAAHVEIIELTVARMPNLARRVANRFKPPTVAFDTLTKSEIKKLIPAHVHNGYIEKDLITASLRSDLGLDES